MAANEDDDSWLYGAGGENREGKPPEIEKNDEEPEEIAEEEQPDLSTETPLEDGEAISEGEVENGDTKDDDDNLNKTEESESKLEDNIEDGMMENDLDDGANAVLDESLADGELLSQEEAGSDDDDSDDDVQVTIGDIKVIPSYGYGSTPVNLNIKRVAGFGAPGVPASAKTTKGLDIDSVGNVNGVPLYDFNLDTMEDKPWRKPGADITDYFNYGFNEDSWKIYCERQRKLRLENNVSGKISVNHVTGLKDQLIPVASVNENSKYSAAVAINLGLKKAGPPPGRKLSGSIDVIGGGAPSLPSRRPVTTTKENVITVMTGRKFDTPIPGIPPPHLAPTHLPPPSFLSVPPEANLSIPPPPPGTILPPTNIPPPPPGTPFTDHFASSRYAVPIVGGPMSGYEDHAGYYNGSTMSHGGTYDETTQQSWPSSTRPPHSEPHRERDRRERSRERDHERSYTAWDYHETRERGMSSRGSVIGEEDYERATSRRHREYHERSRDRERDRERERSTGYERGEYERDDRYERDRDRRHKEHRSEREDRHRERSSRRRHHHESDEEYEHRSSRHKHKRSKRDKDDETSSNAPPSASESQDATELDLKQE